MYMAFLLVRVAFLALQYWICCLLQKEKTRLVVYLELRMEQIIVDRWDLVPGGCIASFEKPININSINIVLIVIPANRPFLCGVIIFTDQANILGKSLKSL